MTDCQDTALRERLPAFAAGTLAVAERVLVEAHLAACPACAAERRILDEVRRWSVPAPPIDAVRIAAAVRHAHPAAGEHPAVARPRPALASAASWGRRGGLASAGRWRTVLARAAAVALLVTGAAVVLRDPVPAEVAGTQPAAIVVASAGDTDGGGGGSPRGVAAGHVSVSYGDLGDLSAEELEVVLARLDRWDGEPSAEPVAALPLLSAGGGGRP